MYAPIIIFTFVRLDHLRRVVDALLQNEQAKFCDVFFISDYGRNDAEIKSVERIRDYIKTITGFKSIIIIERNENYGIERNEIEAITTIINVY